MKRKTKADLQKEVEQLQHRVAEQKTAEGELRAQRDRLELLVEERARELAEHLRVLQVMIESTPDPIFLKEREGRYQVLNTACARALGKESVEEVRGKDDIELISAEQGRQLQENDRRIMDAGETVQYEELVGDRVFLSMKTPFRDEDGNVAGLLGVARDITERKQALEALAASNQQLEASNQQLRATEQQLRASNQQLRASEEKLRESEEQYRTLVGNVPCAVYRADCEPETWTIRYFSDVIEEITGYPASDFINDEVRTYASIIHPEDAQMVEDIVLKAVGKKEPFELEYRVFCADGGVLWVHDQGQGIFGEDGRIRWLDGTVHDITERKQAEEEIRAANQQLRAANQQLEASNRQLEASEQQLRASNQQIRASEEKLQEREARLRAVVESPMMGILFWNAEGDITDANDLFLQMVGYTRDDILSGAARWRDMTPPEFKEQDDKMLAEIAATGVGTPIEKEYIRKDGSRIPILLGAASLPGPELGGVAFVVDITEKKRAEEDLKAERDKAQSYLDMAGVMFLVTNADETVSLINRKGCEILGYEEQEIIGLNIFDTFVPERMRDEVRGVFQKLIAGEIEPVEYYENPWLTKSGEERTFAWHNTVVRDEGGTIIGTLSSAEDITERKQAEETLQASEAKWRSLVENAPDTIFAVDRKGEVLFINRPPEGLSAEDAAGTNAVDYVVPEHRDIVRKAIEHVFVSGESVDFEVSARGPHDTTSQYSTRVGAVKHGDEVVAAMMVTRDITEKATAEEALRATEDQLRQSQKIEAIGRLAGGVAHDFNNMLSAIIGYSDLLAMGFKEGDPARADIQNIRNCADRAAGLTRQLLAFSRKQTLQPRVLDLNEVVTGIEKMLPRLIGEDIFVKPVLSEDLGTVKADPGQIEQVLMNLAVNARDAMPDGGHLTIETANVDLDEEYARQHVAVTPGPYVMLAVSDTGTGMDAETRAQVFEPFFTTKGMGKGTGLGLSTVYGIVKQSGGSIWVYSEPGQGTTFKIYLPRVEAAAEKIDRPRAVAPPKGGSETILVVEDEEAVRDLVCRVLQVGGYNVLSAPHGGEALVIVEQHEGLIDLIITDVVMPHMSGRELADRVDKMKPGTRVLFTSGYTDNAIVHQGVLDEGIPFIQKPYAVSSLLAKVREVLEAPDK